MKFLFLFLAALLLSSCSHIKTPTVLAPPRGDSLESKLMKQRVEFTTDDGVVIVGNWYPVEGALRVALLLHMMPATKESWDGLAKELNRRGIAALAIDLRGHGESTKKGVGSSGVGGRETENINFQRFSDAEHQESIWDVRSAAAWLATQGFEKDQILLVGASIGANLALQFASENSEISRLVLFSPGLEYRGINAEAAIKKLNPSIHFLIVAAEEDEYAANSSERLHNLFPSAILFMFDGDAHGTTILDQNPDFILDTANFLNGEFIYGK